MLSCVVASMWQLWSLLNASMVYKVGYRHFIRYTSLAVFGTFWFMITTWHHWRFVRSFCRCQCEQIKLNALIYIVDDMENILDNIHSKSIEFSITKPYYIIRNKRSTISTISKWYEHFEARPTQIDARKICSKTNRFLSIFNTVLCTLFVFISRDTLITIWLECSCISDLIVVWIAEALSYLFAQIQFNI